MTFTARDWLLWRLAIAAGAGILLARLGPFDTFSDLGPLQRALYWVGLTLLLAINMLVAEALLLVARPRMTWLQVTIVAALAGTVPTAFAVAWAESLLRVGRDLGVSDLLAIYGDVALIALPLVAAMRAVPVRPRSSRAGGADLADRLVNRLSRERRGRLLAFAAEDHYLRVYTDRGNELILRRFADALEDVAGHAGVRVHRGWWVAIDAVEQCKRERDRYLLLLENGITVPISRSFLVAAREAGLTGKTR